MSAHLDHHGLEIVLFDGTNAEEVWAYIQRSTELCPARSCVGCPVGCDQPTTPKEPRA